MTRRTSEREEFLADVITTAVEGGTGYWAAVTHYQYEYDGILCLAVGKGAEGPRKGEGTRATIVDEDDGATHEITVETIARGIGLIARGECQYATAEDYVRRIAAASRENDAGEIDAGDADNIVQAGLFGKLVYG